MSFNKRKRKKIFFSPIGIYVKVAPSKQVVVQVCMKINDDQLRIIDLVYLYRKKGRHERNEEISMYMLVKVKRIECMDTRLKSSTQYTTQ